MLLLLLLSLLTVIGLINSWNYRVVFNCNRNMFGGDNNNPVFPVFLEENRYQYDTNAMPQLQLFGDCECSPKLYPYFGIFLLFFFMVKKFLVLKTWFAIKWLSIFVHIYSVFIIPFVFCFAGRSILWVGYPCFTSCISGFKDFCLVHNLSSSFKVVLECKDQVPYACAIWATNVTF